jgi:hypothetical protein
VYALAKFVISLVVRDGEMILENAPRRIFNLSTEDRGVTSSAMALAQIINPLGGSYVEQSSIVQG